MTFGKLGAVVAGIVLLAVPSGGGQASQARGGAPAPIAAPAAAPASVPATAGRPGPEAFAELPFLSDALLSPDGTRIAARVIVGGREHIGIWALADPRDRPPAIFGGVTSLHFGRDKQPYLLLPIIPDKRAAPRAK